MRSGEYALFQALDREGAGGVPLIEKVQEGCLDREGAGEVPCIEKVLEGCHG